VKEHSISYICIDIGAGLFLGEAQKEGTSEGGVAYMCVTVVHYLERQLMRFW
jgi:hypothetical protein